MTTEADVSVPVAIDPEAHIPVPPVLDAEVKQILDAVDGKRPYGGRLMASTRGALETVAKDVAVFAFHGQPYPLDEWKVKGFVEVMYADRKVEPASKLHMARTALALYALAHGVKLKEAPKQAKDHRHNEKNKFKTKGKPRTSRPGP